MRYFKTVDENNIIDFGYCGKYIPVGSIEITEEEYNSIRSVIDSKPADTETHYYRLKADTLEYEAVERPEPVTMETDPYTAGYDQAVLDCIEGGIL